MASRTDHRRARRTTSVAETRWPIRAVAELLLVSALLAALGLVTAIAAAIAVVRAQPPSEQASIGLVAASLSTRPCASTRPCLTPAHPCVTAEPEHSRERKYRVPVENVHLTNNCAEIRRVNVVMNSAADSGCQAVQPYTRTVWESGTSPGFYLVQPTFERLEPCN